ncbi:MAG: 3-keto-disaccharide hydrolase [Bryobacteraceae bacterium]
MRTVVLLAALAAAQTRPQLNDGEAHGDAPYLIEDGWTPLLDGRSLEGWRGAGPAKNEWFTTRGVRWERLLGPTRLMAAPEAGPAILNGPTGRTVNLVTGQTFGDVELYLEFMLAKGSNSGVYLHGLYEVQIFDSYGSPEPMKTSDGGAIYHRWIDNQGVGGSAPSRNASRRPGEWQSFQIWFRAPRFDAGGRKVENARFVRVLHNGLSVQNNVEVEGPTRAHMNIPEAATNPIMIQGDHGPVALRNIYVRPLRPIINR